jgi:hypothetical protein
MGGNAIEKHFVGALPLGFDAEMGAGFGEGDLDLLAAHEQGDDLGGVEFGVGAEEGLRVAPSVRIAHKHPSHGGGRCVFHVMVGTVSSGSWAAIPADGGRPFHVIVGT